MHCHNLLNVQISCSMCDAVGVFVIQRLLANWTVISLLWQCILFNRSCRASIPRLFSLQTWSHLHYALSHFQYDSFTLCMRTYIYVFCLMLTYRMNIAVWDFGLSVARLALCISRPAVDTGFTWYVCICVRASDFDLQVLKQYFVHFQVQGIAGYLLVELCFVVIYCRQWMSGLMGTGDGESA